MKIQKILCDGCGKEIEGNPIKLFLEKVDRETGDIITDDSAALYAPEKDFCDECYERIKNFIETIGVNDIVLQVKIPTEEELGCIEKMMKDNPHVIMAAEHNEPTVEVVLEEPKSDPKAIQEETISKSQKPTAKDLIIQGKSKAEVMEITGIKSASYDQTKYLLKKNGLLKDNEKKEDPKPDDKGAVKTYKCSEVIHKCFYRGKCGLHTICDYLEIEGHMRGCKPEECDKFREK